MIVFPLQRICHYADVDGDELLYPSIDAYYLAIDSRPLIVCAPRSMPFDGLSIPWGARNLISPLRNRARSAGLFHDAGYKHIARVWCVLSNAIVPCDYPDQPWWDAGLYALCRDRLGTARAAAAYAAVRAGGWYPWTREPRKYTSWETDQIGYCEYAGIEPPTDPTTVPDIIETRARTLIRIHDA